MKKHGIMILLLGVMALSVSAPPNASAQIEDAVKELNSTNSQGYLQPFFDCFANNLNSGIYTSAHIPLAGLHVKLSLVAMGTGIKPEDATFLGIASPYDPTPVKTATIFGAKGTIVMGPSGVVSYRFQDGQITGDFYPFAAPQIELGSFLGTNARVRFFKAKLPGEAGKTIGEISLLGYGLQHSISQYIPLFPIDVSAGFFIQKFDIGDILKCRTLNIGLQASKSFSPLTLFGGVDLNSGTMNVSYTMTGTPLKIDFDMKSKSAVSFHAGLGFDLLILHINGAVYLGKRVGGTLSVGLGI
jgi:hypothetical protein